MIVGLQVLACAERESRSINTKETVASSQPGAVVQPGQDPDWGALPFRIVAVNENQRLLDHSPWTAPGGSWMLLECATKTGNARFMLGIETEKDSAWKRSVLLPIGNGSAFLERFASAFKSPVPETPRRTQPVKPMLVAATILAQDQKRGREGGFSDGGTWIASKWFFEKSGRYAEVYVNFSFEEGVGEFSEKDPDYRDDLLRQVGWCATARRCLARRKMIPT